jgi:glycosyltransferase involved in cell wall biosynthesis
MNIGLDITSLIYQRGVSRYTANLIRALAVYPQCNLKLFGYSLRRKKFLEQQADSLLNLKSGQHQVKVQPIPPSIQGKLWRLGLNKIGHTYNNLDVFHSWDWLQPPDKNLPLVSTIHDLAILKFPETAHPKIVKAHQRSWQTLFERQAHIIAVSHATKRDILELLGFPNWRVHVIPEALPVEIRQVSESLTEEEYDQIKAHLKLERPYILFVGTREPRKNLKRIIEAWQPLSKDLDLIVAGEKGWDEIEYANNQHLRFLGRVSEKELNVLYAEAEIFVYPSLYEGFGLPILEAFYHGTPVITSDISAMIEVAGNAAELVNPKSVEEIRQAMQDILNESQLQQQQRLQRMIIRLQMFGWQQVARETVKVYQSAVEAAF